MSTEVLGNTIAWNDRQGFLVTCEHDPNYLMMDKYPDVAKSNGHPFDFAHALTCHKSQGSEWDTVGVIDESFCWLKDGIDVVNRWRYTAATRARRKLWWRPKSFK